MTNERTKYQAYFIGYQRIARTTDFRTIISATLPRAGYGDNSFLIKFGGGR